MSDASLPFSDSSDLLNGVSDSKSYIETGDWVIDPFAIKVTPLITLRLWNQPQNHGQISHPVIPPKGRL